jgi:hypothetical protein
MCVTSSVGMSDSEVDGTKNEVNHEVHYEVTYEVTHEVHYEVIHEVSRNTPSHRRRDVRDVGMKHGNHGFGQQHPSSQHKPQRVHDADTCGA